ncbi:hypothetical protein DP43_4465 [Burkholderia pseudomallei]|nr:hypothetical protein DP43_4465 [Burkholderia pseudomallei]
MPGGEAMKHAWRAGASSCRAMSRACSMSSACGHSARRSCRHAAASLACAARILKARRGASS